MTDYKRLREKHREIAEEEPSLKHEREGKRMLKKCLACGEETYNNTLCDDCECEGVLIDELMKKRKGEGQC